jgi:hypothetical protein
MALSRATILAALHTHLTADSTFNTAMGGDAVTAGRIRYDHVSEDETLPYAVATVTSDVFWDAMDKQGTQMRLSVQIYEDQAVGLTVLLGHVDKLMARMHEAVPTIASHAPLTVQFDVAIGPIMEGELWRHNSDFMVRTFEA